MRLFSVCLLFAAMFIGSCKDQELAVVRQSPTEPGIQPACQQVESQWGPKGSVALKAEKWITGLEVPWGLAFLPGGDSLVTERAGRIRLIRSGKLVSQPVATLSVGESGEGGLLGIAIHPEFVSNRNFYVYYTTDKAGTTVNRVERYVLAQDHASATADRVILDDIPAGSFHDGGRIKFGPDGKLYVAIGDSRNPDRAQDPASLNGKILRLNPDGSIPSDNPAASSASYVSGVRNVEAFDWVAPGLMMVVDHGPTGELGLTGLDEVSFATSGANLGWPTITGCEERAGMTRPILTWKDSSPPGGAVIYHGSAIPEFRGNLIIGVLGIGSGSAMHLHRVVFDSDSRALVSHEIYLQGQFGRLRDVSEGPDGALYVSTSNCDSRGTCPADKDYILRITAS